MKKRLFLITLFLLIFSLNSTFGSLDWADGNFTKRNSFIINNTSTDNYLVKYINISYADIQTHYSNFSDLVIYRQNSTDATKLNFYLENKSDSNWALIWYEVDYVDNGQDEYVYIYYNNPSQTTSESNPTPLFREYFEDFLGTSLDSDWSTTSGTVSVSGSKVTLDSGDIIWANNTSGWSGDVIIWANSMADEQDTMFVKIADDGTLDPANGLGVIHSDSIANDNWDKPYGAVWNNSVKVFQSGTDGIYDFRNNYFNWKVIWQSDLVQFWQGDSNFINDSTSSNNPYGITMYPQFAVWGQPSTLSIDWVGIAKYGSEISTGSFLGEEAFETDINIAHPLNSTYYYSNHAFNFTVTDSLISTISVKTYIDNVLIYDNASYINSTEVLLDYSLAEKGHNFTVIANGTAETAKTTIFTTEYHNVSTSLTSEVLEESSQAFSANVNILDSVFSVVNATLYWNGTAYSVSGTSSFSKTMTIPGISGHNETVPVFWSFWLNDSFSVYQENATSENQTIYKRLIDNCTFGSIVAYNFTIKNEQTRNSMNGNVTFALEYGSSGQYNQTFNNVDYVELCMYPNISFNVSGQVIYGANSYSTRSYYLMSNTADYITDAITLSLLNAGDSYDMPFTVYDENNEELGDAYILLERWYPETMSYQSAAMGKTDSNGLVSIPLERGGGAWYKITVTYNGNVVYSESKKQFYTSETSYSITASVGTSNNYYNFLNSVSYSYNWTGKVLYLSVTDSSGSNPSGILKGWATSFFRTDSPFCTSTGSGNSFTLLCDASSVTGEASFTATLTYNGQEFSILNLNRYFGATTDNYGSTGILATAFIAGTASLLMIWSPIASVVSIIMGVSGSWIMGFFSAEYTAILSFVFVGIMIIYLLGRKSK